MKKILSFMLAFVMVFTTFVGIIPPLEVSAASSPYVKTFSSDVDEVTVGDTVTFTIKTSANVYGVCLAVRDVNNDGSLTIISTKKSSTRKKSFTIEYSFSKTNAIDSNKKDITNTRTVYAFIVDEKGVIIDESSYKEIDITVYPAKHTFPDFKTYDCRVEIGNRAKIEWDAVSSKDGSTVTYKVYIDGEFYDDTTRTYMYVDAEDIEDYGEGDYWIGVYATAPSHRQKQSSARLYIEEVVDDEKPTIGSINVSPSLTVTEGETITFSAEATDNVKLSKVIMYIDGDEVKNVSASGTSKSINYSTSSLAVGTHTVKVKATDAAGNTKEVTANITVKSKVVTVDFSNVSVVKAITVGERITWSGTVSVSGSKINTISVGIMKSTDDGIYYRKTNVNNATYNIANIQSGYIPTGSTAPTGVRPGANAGEWVNYNDFIINTPGTYWIRISVYTESGETIKSDAYNITVKAAPDTTKPIIDPITVSPSLTITEGDTISFSTNASDETKLSKLELYIGNELKKSVDATGKEKSISFSTSNLAAGTYTVKVKATDAAGNTKEVTANITVKSKVVTVDFSNVSVVKAITVGERITWSGTVSVSGSKINTISVGIMKSTDDGIYYRKTNVNNATYNIANIQSGYIPTGSTAPTGVRPGANAGEWVNYNDFIINTPGTYWIRISVYTESGETIKSDAYNITVKAAPDTTKPIIDPITVSPSLTITEGDTISFSTNASDETKLSKLELYIGNELKKSVDATGKEKSISFSTSNLAAGTYTVKVKATDAAGNTKEVTANITVKSKVVTVDFSNVSVVKAITVGERITWSGTVSVSGSKINTISVGIMKSTDDGIYYRKTNVNNATYNIANIQSGYIPTGSTAPTGVRPGANAGEWVNYNDFIINTPGTYWIRISVYTESGETIKSDAYNITVKAAPDTTKPIIDPITVSPSLTITEGDTISFSTNASDETKLSKLELYIGNELKKSVDATGKEKSISFSTSNLAAGTYTVKVKATDAAGNTKEVTANITVKSKVVTVDFSNVSVVKAITVGERITWSGTVSVSGSKINTISVGIMKSTDDGIYYRKTNVNNATYNIANIQSGYIPTGSTAPTGVRPGANAGEWVNYNDFIINTPGTYWIRISVYTESGETIKSDAYNITVKAAPDTTKPIIDPITVSPSLTITEGDTISFSTNASDETKLSKLELYIGNELKKSVDATGKEKSISFSTSNLAAGTYTVKVKATDAAGNTKEVTANITVKSKVVTVDFSNVSVVKAITVGERITWSGTVSVSGSKINTISVGIMKSTDDGIYYRKTNVNNATYNIANIQSGYIPTGSTAPTGVRPGANAGEWVNYNDFIINTPGTYWIRISVYTESGETIKSDAYNITVKAAPDTTKPIIDPITVSPSLTITEGDTISFSTNASDETKLSKLELYIGNELKKSVDATGKEKSISFSTSNLAAGTYTVKVKATDAAGNTKEVTANITVKSKVVTVDFSNVSVVKAITVGERITWSGTVSVSGSKINTISVGIMKSTDDGIYYRKTNVNNATYNIANIQSGYIPTGSTAPTGVRPGANAGEWVNYNDFIINTPGTYWIRISVYTESGETIKSDAYNITVKAAPDDQKKPIIFSLVDKYSVYMGDDVPLTGVVQTVDGGLLNKVTIKYNKGGLSNNTVVTIDLSKQQMTQFDLANFKISTNKADIFAEPGVYEMVIYASASNYTVKDNCIGTFTVTVLASTTKAAVKNNGIKSVSANVLELSGVIESYGNGSFISCGFEIYNSNKIRIKTIDLPRPVNNTQTIRADVNDLIRGETYYYCTFLETSEGVVTADLVEFKTSPYTNLDSMQIVVNHPQDQLYINAFFTLDLEITPKGASIEKIVWDCDDQNLQLTTSSENGRTCQIVACQEGTYTIKATAYHYDGTSIFATLNLEFKDSATIDVKCLELDNAITGVVYSDALFAKPATEYDHNLTKFAIAAALAAFTADTSKYATCEDRIKNIKELYENIGIDDVTYYNYEVALTDSSHKVAFSIAKKEAIINGEKCIILFSVQRGGGYGAEWASNFCIGASGDAEGFAGAANQVYDQIAATLKKLIDEKGKCNVKIFLTGFSRGAAVTNLIAAKLDREIAQTTGLNITNEDIYAYTFATPQGTVNENAHDSLYDNIFNIVNPGDVVPKVAMSEWEFTRYGRTLEFPVLSEFSITITWAGIFEWWESNKINDVINAEFGKYSRVEFDARENTQFYSAAEKLAGVVAMYAKDREEYCVLLQPVVKDILAAIKGSEDFNISNADNLILEYLEKTAKYTPNEIAAANKRAFECLDWFLYYDAILLLASKLNASYDDVDNLAQAVTIVIELHEPNGAKRFYSELWSVLCQDAGMALVSLEGVLGSDTAQALIDLFSSGMSNIKLGHMPANYAAWVNAFSHEQFLALCYEGRLIHTITCPVDVYVYDPSGNIVASVVNDELVSNNGFNLIIKVDGDVKTVSYPDNIDYRVEIVPRSSGTMSVYVSSQNANGTMGQTAFENIILDVNGEYRIETIVNEDGSKTYALTNQNDNAFEGVTTEQKVVKISTEVIGNGYVSGAGQTFSGLYCTLTANPANGEEFIGWYVGDTLISEDTTYRFFAEESVTFVAKFTQKSNEDDSEGGDSTSSDPSDIVTPDIPGADDPTTPDNDFDIKEFIDSIADKVGVTSDQLLKVAGGSLAALVLLIIVIAAIKRKRR